MKITSSDILFIFTVNNNKNCDKNKTHLATKMVILNENIDNDLIEISNLIQAMNMDTLFIFDIILSNTLKCEIVELESSPNIKYIKIGSSDFIDTILNNDSYDFWKYNKNTLYIFRNGCYADIKDMFDYSYTNKVNIVRGSSQKAHLISPIDFRLSCYLLILCKMNYKKFNSINSFNYLSKDKYLPNHH